MAINALTKAANNTLRLKPIKAEKRNLKVNPLVPYELDMFDIIVLDPPRQGAFEQIKQILLSKVSNIIYVSCNPISFARDASILIEGGFNLEPINPIDQFKFTSHVELLALFKR
jgi:23S rRNA (uracil1939-C5)-methyltransferase